MTIARSRLTTQGQISVPAEIRRKLGIGPGSVIEWSDANGDVVVRRAGRFSSVDIHNAVFGEETTPRISGEDMKEGIRRHMRARHARR